MSQTSHVTPPTPPSTSPPPLRQSSATSNKYRASPLSSRSPSPTSRHSSSVTSSNASSANVTPRKTSSASLILRTSVVDKVYLDKGTKVKMIPCISASQPGVNFINVLLAVFTGADPKNAKRQSKCQYFLLVKLIPGAVRRCQGCRQILK